MTTLTPSECCEMRPGLEEEFMRRRLENTERCCLIEAQGMESIGSSLAQNRKGYGGSACQYS